MLLRTVSRLTVCASLLFLTIVSTSVAAADDAAKNAATVPPIYQRFATEAAKLLRRPKCQTFSATFRRS